MKQYHGNTLGISSGNATLRSGMGLPGNATLRSGEGSTPGTPLSVVAEEKKAKHANREIGDPRFGKKAKHANREIGDPRMGWKIKKLGEVCEFEKTPKKQKQLPYVGLEDIESNTGLFLGSYEPADVKSLTFQFDDSHILYGRLRPYLNKVLKPDFTGHCSTEIFPIKPLKTIDRNYLFHWFLSDSVVNKINATCTGARMPRANMNEVLDFSIPIPPLPEQQRIVAILDEAFAAIAKAKANAEQNLKNAKELFESYLQSVFENGNWEEKRIQDIAKVINGYAFSSKDFKPTNAIKSIKITNVGVKEFVEEIGNYLPEQFKDTLKEVQVKEGNIVIALTRTIISAGLKVAVVPKSYDGALVNQRVAALVANEKLINQRYLYNFLTTDGVAKYVLAHVNTLMQPNLSINDLKNLIVPCPSFKEQQEIVNKLDGLRNETKRLEAIYRQKIEDLDELKKTILNKAFKGEL